MLMASPDFFKRAANVPSEAVFLKNDATEGSQVSKILKTHLPKKFYE